MIEVNEGQMYVTHRDTPTIRNQHLITLEILYIFTRMGNSVMATVTNLGLLKSKLPLLDSNNEK